MIIYTVQPGDTVASVARRYGVSPVSIAQNNALFFPDLLAVGQSLVILIPERTHTVAAGDTVYSVAARYGVGVNELYRINPALRGLPDIYVGQELNISLEGTPTRTVEVNAYVYPNVSQDALRRTLPYLTYMTVFTYGLTEEGELIIPDDTQLVSLIKSYGVAPIMMLSTLGPDGQFSNRLASLLLNDRGKQSRLIGQVAAVAARKGYAGVEVDFEYVPESDREAYSAFIAELSAVLRSRGYYIFAALAPKTSALQSGLLYEAHDYPAIGAVCDRVLIMTYEWGYAFGPPMAVSPYPNVERVLGYAVSEIPSGKIFMGMPNYGYDWTLPFVRGESRARSMGLAEAAHLAAERRAVIELDPLSRAPYFYYTGTDGTKHVVWFDDARSARERLGLVDSLSLAGVSFWNAMRFFPPYMLTLCSMYDIAQGGL